jgi:hypothetical protein
LAILVLSKNLYSKVTAENGAKVGVADKILKLDGFTQDLRLSTEGQSRYDYCEEQCSKTVAKELTPESIQELDAEEQSSKMGSKFFKVSAVCTHLGLVGLQNVTTATIRSRRQEGLPLLVARMKAANALNPSDLDRPLKDDVEVLRQFLWGSPKMRFMLWEVQRVILGTAKAASHQKVLVVFQFPTHIHGYEHTATQSQHYRRAGLLHQGNEGLAIVARRYPGYCIMEAMVQRLLREDTQAAAFPKPLNLLRCF